MDLVIGVLVFMVTIGIIFSLLGNREKTDTAPLRIESEVVATKLTSDAALHVAQDNQLEMDKLTSLAQLANTNYETLKKEFGIKNEFCVYLQDDEGKLVYIDGPGGEKYTGIGSGSLELNISGIPCGKPCTLTKGVCT
jgi:hypothetical protein